MSFMFYLFRGRDIICIRKKLSVLYILNLTDIIFTLLLVNAGGFREVNVIMSSVINKSQLGGVVLKGVVPLILLVWIAYRMRKASELQLYKSNFIITICLIFYTIINMSHVIWCIVYFII